VAVDVVLFDLNGTLVDQSPLAERLTELGAPKATFDAWFQRGLHSALTLSVLGETVPWQELAETTLRTTLAKLEVNVDLASVLELMSHLPVHADAGAALDAVAAAGGRAAVLTNSDEELARELLRRNGLDNRVAAVVGASDSGAYKPVPAPYRAALGKLGVSPSEAGLVAAHAWDVHGAGRAGIAAVWVDRLERTWPLPGAPPARAGGLEEAVRMLVSPRS